MKITYYLMKSNDSTEYAAFESIHKGPGNELFKKHYQENFGEVLETELTILTDSILPFLENTDVLDLLKEQDINCLPIVEVNSEIHTVGRLLTLDELSELTNIGISIQEQ